MKMQESLVNVVLREGEGENISSVFRLSGVLSEWLFSSKFWSDFNERHGTMFDQYEEDEAKAPIVKALAEALEEKIAALQSNDAINIEFVYGWTSERAPLTTSISRVQLLSELAEFHDFLVASVGKNLLLSFSL